MLQNLKQILRVGNTLLAKFFRLVFVNRVPQGLKNNYDRNRISGKVPPSRLPCSKLEKKFPVANKYFVRKIFLTVTCRQVTPRPRKKLWTKYLFRKSPLRPIYGAVLSKTFLVTNTSLGKIFWLLLVDKVFGGLEKNCERNHFRKSPSRPIHRAPNSKQNSQRR